MQHPCFILLAPVCAALLSLPASGQVFKCTDTGGKTIYSQSPCQQTGNSEQIVKIAPPPPPSTAPEKTNYTVNSPAPVAPQTEGNTRQTLPTPARLTAGKTPYQTDQQLVAECEANRGARCNSAQEIAQRRMQNTPPTAEQQRQLQDILRERREGIREREMSRR